MSWLTYSRALRLKGSLGELQAFVYRQVTLADSLTADQIKQARAKIATQVSEQRQELQTLQRAADQDPRNLPRP